MQRVSAGSPIKASDTNTIIDAIGALNLSTVETMRNSPHVSQMRVYSQQPPFAVTQDAGGYALITPGAVFIDGHRIEGEQVNGMDESSSIVNYSKSCIHPMEPGDVCYIAGWYKFAESEAGTPGGEFKLIWTSTDSSSDLDAYIAAAPAGTQKVRIKLAEVKPISGGGAYIHQFFCGNLHFSQGGQFHRMPFDVSIVSIPKDEDSGGNENESGTEDSKQNQQEQQGQQPAQDQQVEAAPPEEDTAQAYIKIEAGHIFLPDGKHSLIPGMDPQSEQDESKRLKPRAGYIVLHTTYNSNGDLQYRYTIENRLPGTRVNATEMT